MKEIFVLLGTLAFVYAIKPLLGAVVLSLFLFYLLVPIVDGFKRIVRFRIISLIISYIVFLFSTTIFLYFLLNSLIREISKLYVILTEEAAKEAGLPEAKLLPIPGK